MKFERKPIEPDPTCAMCGKPIKSHTKQEMTECIKERRNANANRESIL